MVVEKIPKMSRLEQAMKEQQLDEIPPVTEQGWETDDSSDDDILVAGVNDEIEMRGDDARDEEKDNDRSAPETEAVSVVARTSRNLSHPQPRLPDPWRRPPTTLARKVTPKGECL